MKAIAEASGVTQSLLHHHFGVKEALWEAVKEEGIREVLVAMRPQISKAVKDPEFPVVLFERYFETLREHPDYVRLLGWTYVMEGGDPDEGGVPGQAAPLLGVWEGVQGEGKLVKTLTAPTILSLIWTLAEGWFLGRTDYRRRMGVRVEEEQLMEDYRAGVIRMLRRTLYSEARD